MNTVKCVNESCIKRKYCKHWNNKNGSEILRFGSENGFTECIHFVCHEHKFIHVHGEKQKECANCGLMENENKNVRDGFIEWSFA